VWQRLVPRLSAPLRLLGKRVAFGWTVLLGVIALVQFAFDYRPRVEVSAATLLDERDPRSTLFLVTNKSRFHIDNLRFGCELFSGKRKIISIADNIERNGDSAPIGQPPIERLEPGDSATRDCLIGHSRLLGIRPIDPTALRINFSVKYDWPWIGFSDSVSQHFSTRRSLTGNKIVLVPDTEN
jgi:hypothetical protein